MRKFSRSSNDSCEYFGKKCRSPYLSHSFIRVKNFRVSKVKGCHIVFIVYMFSHLRVIVRPSIPKLRELSRYRPVCYFVRSSHLFASMPWNVGECARTQHLPSFFVCEWCLLMMPIPFRASRSLCSIEIRSRIRFKNAMDCSANLKRMHSMLCNSRLYFDVYVRDFYTDESGRKCHMEIPKCSSVSTAKQFLGGIGLIEEWSHRPLQSVMYLGGLRVRDLWRCYHVSKYVVALSQPSVRSALWLRALSDVW